MTLQASSLLAQVVARPSSLFDSTMAGFSYGFFMAGISRFHEKRAAGSVWTGRLYRISRKCFSS